MIAVGHVRDIGVALSLFITVKLINFTANFSTCTARLRDPLPSNSRSPALSKPLTHISRVQAVNPPHSFNKITYQLCPCHSNTNFVYSLRKALRRAK